MIAYQHFFVFGALMMLMLVPLLLFLTVDRAKAHDGDADLLETTS